MMPLEIFFSWSMLVIGIIQYPLAQQVAINVYEKEDSGWELLLCLVQCWLALAFICFGLHGIITSS